MKNFFKSKKGLACIVLSAVILFGGSIFAGYEIWLYNQPKFHDVTVELGTDTVSISQFMTKYAKPAKVNFVTDVSEINLNKVGDISLTLSHGRKLETVMLCIQDTTAPEVDFILQRTEAIGYVPQPTDFIENISDFSDTTVSFAEQPDISGDYADITLSVVVTDSCGNSVQKNCVLSYIWMWDKFALELGDKLTKADLLLDPEKDSHLLDQKELDIINESGVGEYTIVSTSGNKTVSCTVAVQDTRGPELELREVHIYKNKTAALEDFVVSSSDVSGDVKLRLITELSFDTVGTFPVTIEAEDVNGNITKKETVLEVMKDDKPPVISGLSAMSVQKNSSPDYLSGVTANDEADGACEVSYSSGNVDLSSAGTYYITYTSKDKSGNTATAKRQIVVLHDAEDTRNLVKSIAANLSSDPEAIRDYVRNSIGYSTSWGGDDPVWYGFTNKSGNCYVHALCLKALLDEKGFSTQLIWVTDKTHYWLIININGGWKHIDATPSSIHSTYSLMNDEQRLSTLSGRTWDTTAWPACE